MRGTIGGSLLALAVLVRLDALIAVAIINDVKAGNAAAQAADEANWTRNADDIATFLSGANPNWPVQDVKGLMYTHLSTTKAEVVARYTKNYTADVQAWDAVYMHILKMSDAISGGIIKQYPEKFAGPKVYSQKEIDMQKGMRQLWTDHTVWTRLYIIESLNDSPATEAAATRLLKNQDDIGNAIRPLYGDAAGTQLTAKLKEHILIAVKPDAPAADTLAAYNKALEMADTTENRRQFERMSVRTYYVSDATSTEELNQISGLFRGLFDVPEILPKFTELTLDSGPSNCG